MKAKYKSNDGTDIRDIYTVLKIDKEYSEYLSTKNKRLHGGKTADKIKGKITLYNQYTDMLNIMSIAEFEKYMEFIPEKKTTQYIKTKFGEEIEGEIFSITTQKWDKKRKEEPIIRILENPNSTELVAFPMSWIVEAREL